MFVWAEDLQPSHRVMDGYTTCKHAKQTPSCVMLSSVWQENVTLDCKALYVLTPWDSNSRSVGGNTSKICTVFTSLLLKGPGSQTRILIQHLSWFWEVAWWSYTLCQMYLHEEKDTVSLTGKISLFDPEVCTYKKTWPDSKLQRSPLNCSWRSHHLMSRTGAAPRW